jgi:N-methylhydantoinase A
MGVRVGVDTGGTFTDLMAWTDDGRVFVHKTPSTPDDNTRSLIDGLAALGQTAGFAPGDVESVAHGTTVALNTVLQHKWAPIGLMVTEGYRELIEIARQTVPGDWGAIYSWIKPPRVVPLENVQEVRERITHTGEVLTPLDEDGVRRSAQWFRDKGINSVAICFLHSYADAANEERARAIVKEVHPDCFVSISAEVLPEFREYERAMTTCLDAVLMPMVSDYLEHLTGRLGETGHDGSLLMMKSMGGLSRHDRVIHQPISIAFSGPSAGVVGMAALAERIGEPRVLTYDMGGTSTDVALVEDGRPVLTTEGMLDIYPMRTPTIDLVSIGAGGGSIATLGTGNRLRVGPESAGSVPGPACYGRGGTEPTVTDANAVLGRVPTALLQGGLELDLPAAQAAVQKVADGLGLTLEEAAYGILELAAFTMAGAVREVSVKRGRDPRDYALFAYGGAGPLHAAQLAELLGIRRIVVPANPGLGSCLGLLAADVREANVRTFMTREDQIDVAALLARYAELEAQSRAALEGQGVDPAAVSTERFADLRYVGMATEITVPVAADVADADLIGAIAETFHTAHERSYGYAYRGEQLVEIVNVRVVGTGQGSGLVIPSEKEQDGDGAGAVTGSREVYFGPRHGHQACTIVDRDRLTPGDAFPGPAIVEQYDSTVVVPPSWAVRVDGFGNLIIEQN